MLVDIQAFLLNAGLNTDTVNLLEDYKGQHTKTELPYACYQ